MLGDRSQFPDLAHLAYFNHAAIAPPSTRVQAAIGNALEDYSKLGAAAWPMYRDQRDRLRGKLAQLVGATPADLALVASTSQGIVDIAMCFPWRKGDRVILFEGEFPANITPWQRAAELFGVEVTMLDVRAFERGEGLLALERALEQKPARLVAVSAVQFQTGFRMPLEAIVARAHAAGAEVFVDGIQAVGATPIDVRETPVDYLVAGSHKWLMGVEGCAMLYVHPDRAAALRPNLASWLSHEDGASFLFEGEGHLRYDRPIRSRPDFLEIGTMNMLGFAALEAAVEPLLEIGPATIWKHANAILDRLESGLVPLGFTSLRAADPAGRSTILSLQPPAALRANADRIRLFEALAEAGLGLAMPDGLFRFSPHWPNDTEQAEPVVRCVREQIDRLGR